MYHYCLTKIFIFNLLLRLTQPDYPIGKIIGVRIVNDSG